MKQILSLILIFSLLLPLTACTSDQPTDPGGFYYRRIEPLYKGSDGIIAPEQRELNGIRDDLGAVLSLYLSGPLSRDLESPFPRDTALINWKKTNSDLYINFSEAFAELSGVDLTIACGCIARTFLELTDATTVRIQANGALLNGSDCFIVSRDNLSLEDDSIDKLRTELTLYYTDEYHRYLIGKNISVNLASQDNVIGYLVAQLMTAPEEMGLFSPLPVGTLLLDSTVADGTCALNFSPGFETRAFPQSHAQRTTLLSLVNTLTQLDGIEQVEFYLEGNLMARYSQLNISSALVFDESAIGPVRTGMNEFDATLYLSNGSELYLAAVPTRIRELAGISQAELVVNTLISYQNENGFYSTIPSDTVLNQVITKNGHCIVDLSSDFIKESSHLALSVHSIIASVCALDGIHAGQVTIDGGIPVGEYHDLFLPMSPSSDWYL